MNEPQNMPEGFDAVYRAICRDILNGKIDAEIDYVTTIDSASKANGYGIIICMSSGRPPSMSLKTTKIKLNVIKKWLLDQGIKPSFFFPSPKAYIEKTPPTAKESESEKLLKQIGAIALVLAEKSNKYKRGNAPNALQIANEVQEILDAGLIDNKNLFKGKKGTGSTEIRNSISEGLKLLQSDD